VTKGRAMADPRERRMISIPFRRTHVFLKRQWLEPPGGDSRTLTGGWSKFKKGSRWSLDSMVYRDGRDWTPAFKASKRDMRYAGMRILDFVPIAAFAGDGEMVHLAMVEVDWTTGFRMDGFIPVSIAGILEGYGLPTFPAEGEAFHVAHVVQNAGRMYFRRNQWAMRQERLPLTRDEIEGMRQEPIMDSEGGEG